MPTVTRPFDSTSTVASVLAASSGGRCGTTITEVSSRTLRVSAAAYVRHESCSRQYPVPLTGCLPLSL
jgi:hypothetical protein